MFLIAAVLRVDMSMNLILWLDKHETSSHISWGRGIQGARNADSFLWFSSKMGSGIFRLPSESSCYLLNYVLIWKLGRNPIRSNVTPVVWNVKEKPKLNVRETRFRCQLFDWPLEFAFHWCIQGWSLELNRKLLTECSSLGRLLSFWQGLFSGAVSNLGRETLSPSRAVQVSVRDIYSSYDHCCFVQPLKRCLDDHPPAWLNLLNNSSSR